MAVAAAKYGALFQQMVWLGLGAAVVALVLTRVVRGWMQGVR
jgi:POT family proton-dependent oligopeptide transporter